MIASDPFGCKTDPRQFHEGRFETVLNDGLCCEVAEATASGFGKHRLSEKDQTRNDLVHSIPRNGRFLREHKRSFSPPSGFGNRNNAPREKLEKASLCLMWY